MNDLANRWESVLIPGEELCWEGRPAPRCYTFRHWKHSVFGAVFLVICIVWQVLGIEMAATYEISWLAFLPIPFVLIGLYFSVGHLVQARLEWNHVYYAVTNQRLLAKRGFGEKVVQELARDEITYFKMHKQGEDLATLRVHCGTQGKIILQCIEHPQPLVTLLQESIRNNLPDMPQVQE